MFASVHQSISPSYRKWSTRRQKKNLTRTGIEEDQTDVQKKEGIVNFHSEQVPPRTTTGIRPQVIRS